MTENLYQRLKPEIKQSFRESCAKYSTAKRLKYTLMSKLTWQDLTIDELKDLITYSNLSSYEMSAYSFMYGDNILIENK